MPLCSEAQEVRELREKPCSSSCPPQDWNFLSGGFAEGGKAYYDLAMGFSFDARVLLKVLNQQ
ncbi:MAG: hypothetical protein CMN77_12500 [Spirochaetaceae bacterium]|nr:hypothetical protein [Spirochaetaceae bacterium]